MFLITASHAIGTYAPAMDSEFEWDLICTMIPRIAQDVMKLRHRLPIFDPEHSELRLYITRISGLVAKRGTERNDMGLYGYTRQSQKIAHNVFHRLRKLVDSPMQELNLLMWAAEPKIKSENCVTMNAEAYFETYEHLEAARMWVLQRIGQINTIFHDEPLETTISCCRSLLRKGNGDDEEAYRALHVTTALAGFCRLGFTEAGVHWNVVDALWARMKVSPGGPPTFKLSVAGVSYFACVTVFGGLLTALTSKIVLSIMLNPITTSKKSFSSGGVKSC